MLGSEFIDETRGCGADGAKFEEAIFANRSSWLAWPWYEVHTAAGEHTATFFVASDYFAIGDADDFVRCPLSATASQRVADAYRARIPTAKLVDAIWHAANQKLKPITGGEVGIQIGTHDQMSVRAFQIHHYAVQKQLANGYGLIAGHKKDVVLSNRLVAKPHSVAIYGWHKPDGAAIQPLSTVHEAAYRDYSHGLRLVRADCMVDGQPMELDDVLRSPELHALASDEGVLKLLRYPGVPAPAVDDEDTPIIPPTERPPIS